jgi:hypothetical protein
MKEVCTVKPEITSINNQSVQAFYSLYWPQHQILIDFFNQLGEEHYDFRMASLEKRKSESPRESLAHIIFVQSVYLDSAKTGKLNFNAISIEPFKTLSRAELLAKWELCDTEMYTFLTGENFDSTSTISVPWGGVMNAIDLLFFLRDHDILHIGWNLAYMDMLDLPRYNSLMQYWG